MAMGRLAAVLVHTLTLFFALMANVRGHRDTEKYAEALELMPSGQVVRKIEKHQEKQEDYGNSSTSEPFTMSAIFCAAEMTCKGYNDWGVYPAALAACSANLKSVECLDAICQLSQCCQSVQGWVSDIADRIALGGVSVLQADEEKESQHATAKLGFGPQHIIKVTEAVCAAHNAAVDNPVKKAQTKCMINGLVSSECAEAICGISNCCKTAELGVGCIKNMIKAGEKWAQSGRYQVDQSEYTTAMTSACSNCAALC